MKLRASALAALFLAAIVAANLIVAHVDALRTAADDLDKAANQFAGLAPGGVKPGAANEAIFAGKAERARAALGNDEGTSTTAEAARGPESRNRKRGRDDG